MTPKRKICVVTGSRAEYGLMAPLLHLIQNDADLQLQIIATNMHLSPEFGLTYREIEEDGFHIDRKVEMLLSGDTATATVKSMGLGMIGMADAYRDLSPDLIVILGDRYEMLGAASAALIYRIPVAHISGGDVTQGAYDDAIRHSITKMSHLHFTTTEEYRRRVIQLGEDPKNVFNTGNIAIDNIHHLELLSRHELETSLHLALEKQVLLITYHPVTLGSDSPTSQIENLLGALDETAPDAQLIFTMPNSDTNGLLIRQCIARYVQAHPDRASLFVSLGSKRYLSLIPFTSAVIGNSSSGIVEVPSFHIPTVDIGSRQKGRLSAESVIHCDTSRKEIASALKKALSPEFSSFVKTCKNPYEQSDTARRIFEILKTHPLERLTGKIFQDVEFETP